MFEVPLHYLIEDRHQIVALLSKGALDMRRGLIELDTLDEAVLFQLAQGVGEHGVRDTGEVPLSPSIKRIRSSGKNGSAGT